MKRLFFALTALLLVTSCAKDTTTTPAVVEGESVVSFKIAAPQINTRYGEGTTANKLFYAVYQNDELKGEVSALTLADAVDINITADVKIKLVSGLTYKILFWAQNEDAPYVFDGAKVTIDPTLEANEEAYDAFFRCYEAVINGTTPHYVELYRPFAQLNIGTNDIEEAKAAAFDLAKTAVKVKTNTVLDLATGAASTPVELTYALNTKADDTYEGYDIIAMNYLLVGNNGKELVDVAFEAEDAAGKKISRAYTNVPLERNHKTYMLGEILTTTSLFNVVIIPGFDGTLPETAEEKLALAAQLGGEFTLEEDIEVTNMIRVKENFVVNLNGHNIYNKTASSSGKCYVFLVEEGATLTIDGEGEVYTESSATSSEYAVWAWGGTVYIKGGDFSTRGENGFPVIYASGKGKVYISGGTFWADKPCSSLSNQYAALNCMDTDYKAGTADIIVTGGTFKKFNPADNKSEGAGTNFVAEGYKATQEGDNWVVMEEEIDAVVPVGTAQDLMDALNSLCAGNKVVLEKDIDLTGEEWSVSAPWQGSSTDVIFDGGGHKITGLTTSGLQGGLFGKYNSNGNITIKNLTLVDVTITGTNADGESAGGALIGWIENHGGASTVTIENVKVEGIKAEGFKYIGGLIGYNQGATMNLTGCSVNGKADSYLNSTYNESGNYKGHVGGLLGLWNKGTLTNGEVKNLTIKHGTDDMTGSSNRAGALVGTKYSAEVVSATVENVTVDGAAVTVASLFGPAASQVSDTDKANVTIK